MNKIIYQPKAIKQLRKIPTQKAIREKIDMLASMPDCINVKKLSNHLYDYRLRVGNYRVLFNYDGDISIVSIEEVKKRDDRTY
ncbi:type II toxin-antitoxin system RelE/ParE family toxin [Snodgrassella alvi]|uniref:type II toxin-antitoxin system RelE family toxin n=1 Tax=Snodgrassella alvi TaxID=1196083 RepID=UPI003460E0EC